MLAHLLQVGDQLAIAGVEADPQAGQVGALRERVDGDHAVEPVLEDRARRSFPGELAVALVAEDRDPSRPAPRRRRAEVVERAGRVAGAVHPEDEGAGRIVRVDGVEAQAEPGVGRHRHRTAAGEDGAHRVGRVRDGRVEDGVAIGGPQPQPLRQRADELLRADARGDLGDRHVDAEPPVQPAPHAPTAARACRCSAGSPARCPTTRAPARPRRRRVARRADREVHDPTGLRRGDLGECAETVVRVGRGDETARALGPRFSSRPPLGLVGPSVLLRRTARARRPFGSPRAGAARARRPFGSPRAGTAGHQPAGVVAGRAGRHRRPRTRPTARPTAG